MAEADVEHKQDCKPAQYASEDSSGYSSDVQEGVKAIEATARVWTTKSLYIAYAGLFLIQQSIYLDQYSLITISNTASEAFGLGNAISAITAIQSVILACVKTPISRLSDVFGRFELYCFVILIYVLGYIMDASATSFSTFGAAQIFYSFGNGGQQVLQQIFIADTTDLGNRALFSALPYLVSVWSAFAGPQISSAIIADGNYRWGYGIWAICLPVVFIPFALSLYLNKRKAKKLGLYQSNMFRNNRFLPTLRKVLVDVDAPGILLFAAFAALILLPLNLAPVFGGYNNGSYIAMFVIGGVSLIAFIVWERLERFNPKPFFPKEIFESRSAVAGFALAFFYFFAFYMSVYPYYYQYLYVVFGQSASASSYIVEVFTLASSPAAVVTGLLIKYTGHIKYWIVFGSALYITGIGLLIRYRDPSTSVASLVGLQILIGVGGGILNVPTQVSIQMSVSHQQVAAVTGIYLTLLEIGGAVGAAVSGAIWNSIGLRKLEAYLPAENKAEAATIFGSYLTDVTTYPMGTPVREALNRSYDETLRILLIVAVCIAALTFPLALLTKNHNVYGMDQKVAGRVIGGREETTHLNEAESPPDPAATNAAMARDRRPWPMNRFGRSRQ